MKYLLAIALSAAVLAASPRHAAGEDALGHWLHGELRVGTGIDYSRGDYGEDATTDMIYVPFSLAYTFDDFAPTPTRRDQLELRAVLPYLYVDGVLTSGASTTEREDGIGDLLVTVAYLYYPVAEWAPASEWSIDVKVPTASESDGLGTGETDVALELALFQRFGDFVPFASGSYRFIGDNRDYDLRNGATASVGASWLPHPGFSVGVSYDWRQSISRRSTGDAVVQNDDAHELTLFGALPLVGGLRLAPYAVAGLSQGSPDFAVGAQIHWTVPFRSE